MTISHKDKFINLFESKFKQNNSRKIEIQAQSKLFYHRNKENRKNKKRNKVKIKLNLYSFNNEI